MYIYITLKISTQKTKSKNYINAHNLKETLTNTLTHYKHLSRLKFLSQESHLPFLTFCIVTQLRSETPTDATSHLFPFK